MEILTFAINALDYFVNNMHCMQKRDIIYFRLLFSQYNLFCFQCEDKKIIRMINLSCPICSSRHCTLFLSNDIVMVFFDAVMNKLVGRGRRGSK